MGGNENRQSEPGRRGQYLGGYLQMLWTKTVKTSVPQALLNPPPLEATGESSSDILTAELMSVKMPIMSCAVAARKICSRLLRTFSTFKTAYTPQSVSLVCWGACPHHREQYMSSREPGGPQTSFLSFASSLMPGLGSYSRGLTRGSKRGRSRRASWTVVLTVVVHSIRR